MGTCSGTRDIPSALLYPDLAGSRPRAAHLSLPHPRCARANRSRMGWRGALYAWESADTGAETTRSKSSVRIVRLSISFAARRSSTLARTSPMRSGNTGRPRGREVSTRGRCRDSSRDGSIWASRALQEADGYCHIRNVIGPDEYHEHIDDNAFTNVMARWNIRRAIDAAALLRERWPECWASLSSRLGLDDAELNQWRSAADTIATGLDPKTGLFEQFAGYFAPEDIDLADYAGRSVPMDVVLGRQRTQGSR